MHETDREVQETLRGFKRSLGRTVEVSLEVSEAVNQNREQELWWRKSLEVIWESQTWLFSCLNYFASSGTSSLRERTLASRKCRARQRREQQPRVAA